MVLHRSAKADPSGYPGSIPGVSVFGIELPTSKINKRYGDIYSLLPLISFINPHFF